VVSYIIISLAIFKAHYQVVSPFSATIAVDAPNAFLSNETDASVLYEDLKRGGRMAHTTLDILDSDFDAGKFMPRLKQALAYKEPSAPTQAEIKEQLLAAVKKPRGFQNGLVKVRLLYYSEII